MEKLIYVLERLKGIFCPPVQILPAPENIIIEKDVKVPMRDGVKILVNIFRPDDNSPHPVIICFHPYGKDILPKKGTFGYSPTKGYRVLRQPGEIKMSCLTSWEAPDPAFWVQNGYVVINGDTRGYGKSEGTRSVFSGQEARDYYDLIEWAGKQPWSNGKIGLNGVSYLAISQYKVAALQPPHLAAICPWEGLSNLYRDLARPGGIREDGFLPIWSNMTESNIREQQRNRILEDEWYKSFCADLTKITVPALICGSFSDQSLHTQGSFRVFDQISSKHRWLYTHRDGKWCAYYSPEALAFQLKFFDYFLKDKENDLLSTPPVRLEVREDRTTISEVSYHSRWPLSSTKWQQLYLNASSSSLEINLPADNPTVAFDNEVGTSSFSWKIQRDLKVVGPMKLKLFIEVEGCNDVNLFVAIRKFKDGSHVSFEGSYGFGFDCVTKGWLKASLRHLEASDLKKPWEPEHTFDREEPLKPKEIVALEISLLPSATLFLKGEELRLDIQGHPIFKRSLLCSQASTYESSQAGKCIIHSGKKYDSHLLIPIVE